jgi:tripartite ATP-independent transporter DctP family solute receptor
MAAALAAGLLLGAVCSGNANAAETLNLKFSLSYNPKSRPDAPHVRAPLAFKRELEKRLGDKVTVSIFWDNQLAKTYEAAVNALQNGLIHFTQIPMSTLSEYSQACVPFTDLFLIPYPHTRIAHKLIDGELSEIFRDRVAKETGLRLVAFWEVGFRHVTSVKKPIHSLDDLKGMKIRVQPNPVHLAAFSGLGANPTPIAWAETFTALQQNVVDGAENPFRNIIDARLYEVQKHIALTGHTFEFVCFLTSEKFYRSLTEEQRKAWDESLAVATAEFRELSARAEQDDYMFLKDKMEIFAVPEAEMAKFRNAVQNSRKIAAKAAGEEYTARVLGIINKEVESYMAQQPK